MEIVAQGRVRDGQLIVVHGDLTTVVADVIVNAANERLRHGGGVAHALASAGGPEVVRESDAWVRAHGTVPEGKAAVTTAGRLPAGHLVHVVGPRFRTGQDNAGMLRMATVAALSATADLGAESMAMPAISAGIFGYPIAEATQVIVATTTGWLVERALPRRIILVGRDPEAAAHFAAAMDEESVGRPGGDD